MQVNTLTESWIIEEVIGIIDQMFPELEIDILTKDQKIARDCHKVEKMFPLLNEDNKLSIDDFLEIQSDDDNIEQLRQQLKQNAQLDPLTLCFVLFDYIKRRIKLSGLMQELSCAIEVTQVCLFNFLMHNSNEQLRSLICISYC